MTRRYSTYEAKAKFGELIRRVRDGEHVIVSYRGTAVAEIRPIYRAERTDEALADLEARGVISPPSAPAGPLEPRVAKPGALRRFLESRD